jgi:hypothetical protein
MVLIVLCRNTGMVSTQIAGKTRVNPFGFGEHGPRLPKKNQIDAISGWKDEPDGDIGRKGAYGNWLSRFKILQLSCGAVYRSLRSCIAGLASAAHPPAEATIPRSRPQGIAGVINTLK